MPRSATRARPGRDRASLYTEITSKIIAELEAGRVPWVQPWGGPDVCAGLGLPQNAATRRRYSGINILILWGAVTERGFSSQNWLTFRQALGLGGNGRALLKIDQGIIKSEGAVNRMIQSRSAERLAVAPQGQQFLHPLQM